MNPQTLKEFFPSSFMNDSAHQHSLGEQFTLCDHGNLVFHWADFNETCETIKTAIETNRNLNDEFHRKEQSLTRLSMIPIWIRTNKKVHQTTMFDLYENFVTNEIHCSLGFDPYGPIEVSFISSTGPYKTMPVSECFNRATYIDFVMVNLLKDRLPKRDYRIRLKAKLLMEFGHTFAEAGLISLEQLTLNGMLLSVDSDLFLNKMIQGDQMRIYLDTDTLNQASSKDLSEMKNFLSHFTFNLLYSSKSENSLQMSVKDFSYQSSFDFVKNKRIFLFMSYDKIQNQSEQNVASIKKFVGHTKELVRLHYKSTFLLKTA